MKLLAFLDPQGRAALGACVGDELVDLTALGLPATLDELLRHGEVGLQAARDAVARATTRRALTGITYLPPLQQPAKALAIGLNYKDHAAESRFELPKHPVVFQRYPSSWVAHGQPLVRPKVSVQFDYEAELVAVIGRAGRHIPKARALDHVAGYSMFNDGSRHTEAAALLQYLADQDPAQALIGEVGSTRRLAVTEWLAFVASELHKAFSPWLWHKETADSTKRDVKAKLAARFAELDRHLATRKYLAGEFSVADAYAFTIVNWSNFLGLPLSDTPHLRDYLARVSERPAVQAALRAEGLTK